MYQYHCLCIIHFQPSFLDNKWKDLSRMFCSLLARWLHLLFPTCFSLCLIRFGLVTEQKLVNLNVSESFTLYMACFYCTWACGCTWEGSFWSAHFRSAKKQTVLLLFHLSWRWIASVCRPVYVCGTTCVAGFYCFTLSHLQPGSPIMSCCYNQYKMSINHSMLLWHVWLLRII